LTLIRAMAVVAEKVPEARLVFMGMKHPNPDVPAMAMANHSRELAEQLGLTGRHVFFNETWVPYQDRADLLLDADIGVSCHFDHIETEFSFRTRILDYLWAGLPIVCTQGDAFATLVETEGLGATAAPEDVLGLATALIDLLTDEPARAAASERVKEVAKRFTWRQSLAPLMAFMADPRRAPDLHPDTPRPHTPAGFVHRPKFGPRADLALFRTYLDQGGPGELVRRMTGRVRRIARETVSGR
jgi:2-polyprenyl-6-methoxyphenol hydroxylase-like FAD-dependent oxidoreductase